MSFLKLINLPLTLSITFLLSIGILVIYSSSSELASYQLLFAAIGLILYFIISQFDYRTLKDATVPLYFVTLILLVIVFIFGVETRGSIRWISLGAFNIQPSEFAKPVLILLLAKFWSENLISWKNIGKSFLITLPFLVLIFKQPDLGSALTILAIWMGILFAAKIPPKKIVILVLTILLIIPIPWFLLHDYQRVRIQSFLSPESDPLGVGYNLIQSTIAVGSGEFFGRGLGRGTQSRLQFLPEFRTDFIYASIAEELGFLGSILILTIYLFIIIYCLGVTRKSADFFGFLVVFGVISLILFQAIVNIGMNIGLVPVTGITLPLISYGGSSLISTLVSLGMVGSICKYRRRIDIE